MGKTNILVSTDFIRGIERYDAPLVVNYDLSANSETYIHRIAVGMGHGRNDRDIVLSFAMDDELFRLADLEQLYHVKINRIGSAQGIFIAQREKLISGYL